MRMLGMHGTAFANYAVDDCDFLIAVGARFDDRVAGVPRSSRRTRSASRTSTSTRRDQQGQARALEPCRPARAGARRAAARARAPVSARLRAWHAVRWRAEGRARDELRPRQRADPAVLRDRGDQPADARRGDHRTGVGQHQMWAAQYCDFREPRLWLTSGSMGTMGFGLPAAIGAQFANPDKLVIDIDGDAEHPHEPRRARDRHHLRPAGQGRRAEQLRRRHGQAVAEAVLQGALSASDKSLHKKDFVRAAQADGFAFRDVRLDRKADVPRVVEEFIRSRARPFLEVIIDPDAGVYPMVGPGQAYDAMITGDFIDGVGRR
jgi:acetolactate synthase-1/2/3 large subunit